MGPCPIIRRKGTQSFLYIGRSSSRGPNRISYRTYISYHQMYTTIHISLFSFPATLLQEITKLPIPLLNLISLFISLPSDTHPSLYTETTFVMVLNDFLVVKSNGQFTVCFFLDLLFELLLTQLAIASFNYSFLGLILYSPGFHPHSWIFLLNFLQKNSVVETPLHHCLVSGAIKIPLSLMSPQSSSYISISLHL